MSREIPMDQALTDEDRRYLRQRGSYGMAIEARLDDLYPPDPDAVAAFEAEERREAAQINGVGLSTGDQASLIAENQKLQAELQALRAGKDIRPSEEIPNYTGWTKAELEAEIDRVNAEDPKADLSKGKVDEMKATLTDYFKE